MHKKRVYRFEQLRAHRRAGGVLQITNDQHDSQYWPRLPEAGVGGVERGQVDENHATLSWRTGTVTVLRVLVRACAVRSSAFTTAALK